MNRDKFRSLDRQILLDNKSHNILIHGYLQCIQEYVLAFGLESTAALILRRSGICKDDLIRCQLENGHENERMLELIERAFKLPMF